MRSMSLVSRMKNRRPTKIQGEIKHKPNIRNIIGRCFGGILTWGFVGLVPHGWMESAFGNRKANQVITEMTE